MLILSVYLGFNGSFYKRVMIESCLDIKPGESAIIEVSENKAFSKSFVVDGSYLAGQTIPQNIEILSQSQNVFVRAKLLCDEENIFSLSESEKFSYENDGYFYYNDVLNAGEKATLTTEIKILHNANMQNDKKYLLTIVVEILSEDVDVNLLWKN